MFVLIDNYDSFSFNLYQEFLKNLSGKTVDLLVFRNDKVTLTELENLRPRGIIISPGPGGPADSGISGQVVRHFARKTPILGVCLGHQVIAEVFGAKVVRSQQPRHGKTSSIEHNKQALFNGVESPFKVARYHSLCVSLSNFPVQLEAQAYADDGTLMALRHKDWPIFGLQFHPESFLTEFGVKIIENFIGYC